MATRDATNSSTTPKPNGLQFLDEYSGHIGRLYDASLLTLAGVSGADTITATVEPVLPVTGLKSGMKFSIEWASDNTGAATLNIGGTGPVSIVAKNGGVLEPGQLAAGSRDFLEYDGTNFILVTGGEIGGDAFAASRTIYDVTTVWENNYPDATIIMVECWGAGAGGDAEHGGGGGGYQRGFLLCGDLPSSVTITVPSGGGAGLDGGNCTFGSFITGHGGKSPDGAGGVGGGVGPSGDVLSGIFGGSAGATNGGDAAADASWGGAGGGALNRLGGDSEYGGNGGNGGSPGSPGARPGGGGGPSNSGGPGRCIVTVF